MGSPSNVEDVKHGGRANGVQCHLRGGLRVESSSFVSSDDDGPLLNGKKIRFEPLPAPAPKSADATPEAAGQASHPLGPPATTGSRAARRRAAMPPALLPALERFEDGLIRLEQLEGALEESLRPVPDWEEMTTHMQQLKQLSAKGSASRRAVVTFIVLTVLLVIAIIAGCQIYGIYGWPRSTSPNDFDALHAAITLDTRHIDRPWYPPHESSPTSQLSDVAFLRLVTIIVWATVCTTGLGMELVLGEPFVKFLSSDRSHILWKGVRETRESNRAAPRSASRPRATTDPRSPLRLASMALWQHASLRLARAGPRAIGPG